MIKVLYIIKYFIYDDNMQELDLSLCSELNTHIHYAIKNNSKLDISSISEFKENGVDLLNIKDRFFNDLCYSYSDSENDMILEDRIKYLYQNYSLCESGCTYDYLDIENMNIACNCKIQGNDNTSSFNQTSFIFQQPRETSFFDSNIGVVKCYNLVFSLYNKANNIGFIVFSILFFIYLIFIFCFCRNGIKPVREYLLQEMKLNGYLNNNNNEFIKKEKESKEIIDVAKKNNKSILNPNKIKKSKKLKSKKIPKPKKFNSNNLIQINSYNNTKNKRKIKSLARLIKDKTKKTSKTNNEDSNNTDNFGIIKINLNNYKNYTPIESNQSLHNYTFENAIKYDKRNIFRISYIYLLSKQIIFRTFLQKCPLEIFPLRFTLFIFMLSCDLALNALFYFHYVLLYLFLCYHVI